MIRVKSEAGKAIIALLAVIEGVWWTMRKASCSYCILSNPRASGVLKDLITPALGLRSGQAPAGIQRIGVGAGFKPALPGFPLSRE